MKLFPGNFPEYKKRHYRIWPELSALLKNSGIREYSIFFDEATNTLFATLKIQDEVVLQKLAQELIMKKWWTYMKDLMETNEDDSPVTTTLQEVFYMP